MSCMSEARRESPWWPQSIGGALAQLPMRVVFARLSDPPGPPHRVPPPAPPLKRWSTRSTRPPLLGLAIDECFLAFQYAKMMREPSVMR